ncbi:MAG: DUF4962 domain-containing protein [Planctomycetota bacterium]
MRLSPALSRFAASCAFFLTCCLFAQASELPLDESPARPGEWGFRPAEGRIEAVTPPGFSWRPQEQAANYELEITGGDARRSYEGIGFSVFCPPDTLVPGTYSWRFRYLDRDGDRSAWSRERAFTIAEEAEPFPLAGREELLARIPTEHPRLFLRPEQVAELREAARGKRKEAFNELIASCNQLLASPPPSEEPPKYPQGMATKSEEWREVWWGNRVYTIKTLESAATLAFTGLIAEKPAYQELAKRLLLDAARWDPQGATGYRYNDEAGMPYAYHFSRAYTFLHPVLSDEEKELCRKVMLERGREIYRHLCPGHLWRPYSSHSNRAWHFLGEVGIAFKDEIPEAGDWVWFAANVFRCVYPVWSDDDGGWHEGTSYWLSYVGRFTWWADVMRAALGLDAYQMPYFSRVGDYALYRMTSRPRSSSPARGRWPST